MKQVEQQGWVALICFGHRSRLLKQGLLNFFVSWQVLGKRDDVVVKLAILPWTEEHFAHLPMTRQREVLLHLLKNAKKNGAQLVGLPLNWRSVLGTRVPLKVADGRPLAVELAIADMVQDLGSLKGRDIAIIGMDESWSAAIPEKLASYGCNLILSGVRAEQISEDFYRREGWALPVLGRKKAALSAAGTLALSMAAGSGVSGNIYVAGDRTLRVDGDWLAGNAFSDGYFSCGLAAALLQLSPASKHLNLTA